MTNKPPNTVEQLRETRARLEQTSPPATEHGRQFVRHLLERTREQRADYDDAYKNDPGRAAAIIELDAIEQLLIPFVGELVSNGRN